MICIFSVRISARMGSMARGVERDVGVWGGCATLWTERVHVPPDGQGPFVTNELAAGTIFTPPQIMILFLSLLRRIKGLNQCNPRFPGEYLGP